MKVSRKWLQKYFNEELPEGQVFADTFTFHAFEVEEQEGDLLDLKVLPDRAGYALSHRGIAYELSATLGIPLKYDPLREPLTPLKETDKLVIETDPAYVVRHMGAIIRGVKVGPSPEWLKDALATVGQRSINNVVDILNYVLLDIGQPSGVFDLGKIQLENGVTKISIRRAKTGEKIKVLTGETYELSEDMFVFTDAVGGTLLDIAGIKGGLDSGVTESTTDIFLSVGNYDGTLIRRASQKLKLFTDASQRYQNRPSPQLCAYGMRDILALLKEIAGGEFIGAVDFYPSPKQLASVTTTRSRINGLLGSDFSQEEILNVFKRLNLITKVDGEEFTVTPPFERTDLTIPEDLAEETGRILGYDRVAPKELPAPSVSPDQARFCGIERMKDELVEQGFIEVSTQSFAKKGDILLANPLDKSRPYLRTSLEEGLTDALKKAKEYAPLILPPNRKPKLFEVGSVFPTAGEYVELCMTEVAWEGTPTHDNLNVAKLEEYGKEYEPKRYDLSPFKPFSQYPYIVRDVAIWVPNATEPVEVLNQIKQAAGELAHKVTLFDRFEKVGKTSLAYRIIFQSFDRTLTEVEVNQIMAKIGAILVDKGFEIR